MSLYRNALFFLKGIHEFTRGGYDAASATFTSKDLEVNVSGKSFMITGANSGIGKAAAIEIAKRGGTIHMVCRIRDRALEAKDEIVKLSGNENVFVHVLDMSETKKIWQFAENFKKDHTTLDVLINNAGCMVHPRQVTKEGFEVNFATNTVGTYVLTTCLIAVLEKSEEPRVITVSSGGMLVQKLEVNDLQCEKGPYDATMVYAQNKRQQVVMTEQWAKMKTNIHFSVMHPGWADTQAVRMAMPEFYGFMKTKLRSPEQGADTVVWLAVSKAAISHPSGLFFQDRTAVATHLPLAWTRSSPDEDEAFMETLQQLLDHCTARL